MSSIKGCRVRYVLKNRQIGRGCCRVNACSSVNPESKIKKQALYGCNLKREALE